MKRTFLLLAVALSVAAAAATTTLADGRGRGRRVEVTITNLTAHQILSPAVVATHDGRFEPMFRPGDEASAELRQIAEDAVNDPMLERLMNDHHVGDFGALEGAIMPGASRTIELEARGDHHYVSLVGMLVTTNDGFYGVSGVRIPTFGHRGTTSPAYDAGTEENNELCANIPGPPCGNLLQPALPGEGFVHIHRGIHGIGNLDASIWDWRNPVAQVTIRRVR